MKEFLSGLTLGTIIALTTLLIVSVAIAQPNPGHSADQIGPGTFSPGDYAFPNNLNVSGTLRLLGGTIEKHDDSRLNIYTDRDAYHSRAWIELWGADPSRGGELTLAGTYIDFRYNSTNSSYGTIGMKLSTQGKLGIGTTSPEWKLDVNGNAQIRGNYLRIGNGNPRAYVYADANNMIFTLPGGNNEFHFKDKDGNIRVWISSTGNLIANGYGSFNGADRWTNFVTSKTGYGDTIGIGGDDAGNDIEIRVNAPSSRNTLTLWNSNLNENVNFVAKDIRANGDISWGSRGTLSRDQGASIELGGTGKPYIDFSNDATTDYDVRIQLTGNDALSIQGGRVGIGTSNPDPYVGLDIRNSESLGNRGQIIVDTYLLRSTPNLAYVPSDAAAHIDVYNDDLYIVLHNWDGTTGRGIYFSTKQGENQVGIKYGGNVEIYSGDLDVQNGALYIKKDVGDWGRIARFYDPSMATDENIVIHLGKSDGGPAAEIGFRYRGDTSDQNILFLGHYAAPYIVNIRKDGKVGIGTDNPQVRLDVNGGVRIGDESTCNSDTQGTLRYYCDLDVCKCYFKICMRTGDTSYSWQNVLVTSWDCGIIV